MNHYATLRRKHQSEQLNQQILHLLNNQSYQFFVESSLGSLVNTFQTGIRGLIQIKDDYLKQGINMLLSLIWIVCFISLESKIVAIFLILSFCIYCLIQYIRLNKLAPYRKNTRKSKQDQDSYLSDIIGNIFTIKAFGSEANEEKNYLKKVTQASNAQAENEKQYAPISISNDLLSIFLVMLFWGGGVFLWKDGSISIGTLIFFSAYLGRIENIFSRTPHLLREFFRALNEVEGLLEISNFESNTKTKNTKKLICKKGEIKIQNLTFAYQKEEIFKDFNLHIQAGEKVAIIGRSGSGKSTLINLLYRFYELKGGSILIDNQNINEYSPESLRSSLSLVPQSPLLFHRTIKENIAYAQPEATDEEIINAAKLARCSTFIENLPKKYETLVGEKGYKLSGGERQRIAIARAILANKKILIMDEATSALDSESESEIQEALQEVMKNKTCIIIAHRLSTIMQMDRIIVIDKGKIIEQGSHKELLEKKDGLYQKLWNIQSGAFLQLDNENILN